MEKVFDISTMAHYRFGADGNFLLNDNFRNQKGVTIGVPTAPDTVRSPPILEYDDGTFPFCSTLTEWISVPHLTNKFTLPEVDVPVYAFAQTKFAYALSMWVYNTGE